MYKVVSLFSGCGGADLGMVGNFNYNHHHYKKLPFRLVYATDIDQKAINTHLENFGNPKITKCADICDIPATEIPECDIIVGGFPCQSFSTVNPKKDPFDARGNLYKQMVRLVAEKQPKVFIAENVKGFLRLYKGTIYKKVVAAFEKQGYTVYTKLVNAADYEVPQKRERVILVGIRNDINKILKYDFPEEVTKDNWVPLSVAVHKLDIDNPKYYFSERAVWGMKHAKNNMKRGLYQDLSQPCLTITSHLAKVSLNSRDPVLLVSPEKELYRRFTPREAARIQSFPDSFVFTGSDGDAYRQIGNAIPPVMFWHISNSIKRYLNDVDKLQKDNNEIRCIV